MPLLMSCASISNEQHNLHLEKSVCGLKEPIVFWLWNNTAGKPNSAHIIGLKNLEDISFSTKDNRILRGYRLKADSPSGNETMAKGYLLVAQGNAMLADRIIRSFQDFTSAGYDVYLFDYRGYGRSEGKRRLRAILSDYGEIIDHLDALPYARRLFYGMSFGGIVLLDALQGRWGSARLVIDSTPSRLSGYGCPEQHDAVSNLPQDCSHVLLISGGKDTVVTPSMSRELVTQARLQGATLYHNPDLAHPFMDSEASLHQHRMGTLRSFLLDK